ncbi:MULTISPECIES: hypothetical protein [Lysobacter]|uniref:Uncharacterized protein n=1 Tax=Lysobacter firmicutimachus TaxID=1792846 RepID=A0ABU8D7N5_9GAMM|nr:hypothetical protein [Lysobacter antibioticus]
MIRNPAHEEYQDIAGVLAAPADEPATWYYRAKAPALATDNQGRPQFSLVAVGAMAMLSLTAVWGVDADRLGALRAELAVRAQLPPEQVRLYPAPVEVGEAVLQIGDGQGGYLRLASSRTSGAPPYHAAFSAMLAGEQLDKARKALSGQRGWLEIRYLIADVEPALRERTVTASESSEHESRVRDGTGEAGFSSVARSDYRQEDITPRSVPKTHWYAADAADWGLPRS